MKLTIAVFLLCCITFGYSQDYPPKTKHVKTINVTVYKKKDTVQHKKLYTYYDEDWNMLTNTNNISSALDEGTKRVTIVDTDREFKQAVVNADKDTVDYIVYLYDENKNRTHYYQIRKGDTLNDQKRTYDKHGNNIQLFNKKDGAYFLRYEAEFNEDNKQTFTRWYNPKGQLTKITEMQYSKDGKTKSYYKSNQFGKMELQKVTTEIAPHTFKINYHKDAIGVNYGIRLVRKRKYHAIEEYDEDDRLKKMEIFDKRKRLTTSIYVTYEEVN